VIHALVAHAIGDRAPGPPPPPFGWHITLVAPAPAPAVGAAPAPPPALAALISARQVLEDSGYRAPACLIASTAHFNDLAQWVGSNVATEGLLVGANANSLHRATQLNAAPAAVPARPHRMIMIGRARHIEHGCAASASPGEEPVDIAVSVPPSLEMVGENAAGLLEFAVRIRFATRFKDERGVVVFSA
jgi:hypothetical protein